jgi:hypothetical protein
MNIIEILVYDFSLKILCFSEEIRAASVVAADPQGVDCLILDRE